MQPFTRHSGIVAPFDRANVDTDLIIPNQPRYKDATILLTRDNVGCGSSREHAPWALLDYGFRVLLAPSFADIFYNNCCKNGILPIILDENTINRLFQKVYAQPGLTMTVVTACSRGSTTSP